MCVVQATDMEMKRIFTSTNPNVLWCLRWEVSTDNFNGFGEISMGGGDYGNSFWNLSGIFMHNEDRISFANIYAMRIVPSFTRSFVRCFLKSFHDNYSPKAWRFWLLKPFRLHYRSINISFKLWSIAISFKVDNAFRGRLNERLNVHQIQVDANNRKSTRNYYHLSRGAEEPGAGLESKSFVISAANSFAAVFEHFSGEKCATHGRKKLRAELLENTLKSHSEEISQRRHE